ncbi:MAG: hypothetical protein ACK55I_01725, partial [bacterium]
PRPTVDGRQPGLPGRLAHLLAQRHHLVGQRGQFVHLGSQRLVGRLQFPDPGRVFGDVLRHLGVGTDDGSGLLEGLGDRLLETAVLGEQHAQPDQSEGATTGRRHELDRPRLLHLVTRLCRQQFLHLHQPGLQLAVRP